MTQDGESAGRMYFKAPTGCTLTITLITAGDNTNFTRRTRQGGGYRYDYLHVYDGTNPQGNGGTAAIDWYYGNTGTTTYTTTNAGGWLTLYFENGNDGNQNERKSKFRVTITCNCSSGCDNATSLPCGTTNLAGTTVGTPGTAHGTGYDISNYGVWYTFVGDGNQTTISSTATFDHGMAILRGSCNSLTGIANIDDYYSGYTESYTFTTTVGVTYYVYIAYYSSYGTSSETGTFTISRTCCTPRLASIEDCPGSMYSGESLQLHGSINQGGGTVTWSSSYTACVTVTDATNGNITAHTPSTATITYTRAADGSYCQASTTCSITVLCVESGASLSFSPSSGSVDEGQTLDLSEYLSNPTGSAVSWSSSNTGVATVSSGGVVAGVGAGAPVTITAQVGQWTSDGITYCALEATFTVNVNVVSCDGESWEIDDIDTQTKTIECGKTYCFYDSGGESSNYSNYEDYSCHFQPDILNAIIHIKFLSYSVESGTYDYMTIAGTTTDNTYTSMTVGQEFVAASENGTIDITWTSDYSQTYAGWKAIIWAENCCTPRTGAAGFQFCKSSINVEPGTTFTLPVSGADEVSPTGTVTYTSSNTSVANVNSDGTVTAGSTPGTATITATIPAATISGTDYCAVTASYTVKVATSGTSEECSQIGDGSYHSSGNYGGIYGGVYTYYNDYAYTQQVYTAAELAAGGACAGKVTKVIMHYYDDNSYSNDLTFDLYIGQTSQSTASTSWITDAGLTQVYSGTYTFSAANDGWNTIDISSANWTWDGTSNIVLAFHRTDNTTPSNTQYPNFYYTNTSNMCAYVNNSYSSITLNANNVATSTGTTTSQRPEVKFCTQCTFTPTPIPSVSLSSNTQSVCTGIPINDITVTATVPDGGSVTLTPSDKGLSYNSSTHKITGNPNFTGSQTFTLTVKDAENCMKDEKTFTVTVNSLEATIEFGD